MSKAQELADKLTSGISTGSDWPNTEDEVLRLNAAAELRRLDRVNAELVKQNEAQKDEWLSWEAKRKGLEREAERYRWVRDNADVSFDEQQHFPTSTGVWIYSTSPSRRELDAAIDTALSSSGGTES